jgi:hypothetical protein
VTLLRDEGLQAFKFGAPDRFHILISHRVASCSRISDADGSYLHEVRLRSRRKLDPISRIGRLSENDPTARDL